MAHPNAVYSHFVCEAKIQVKKPIQPKIELASPCALLLTC